MSQSLTLTPPMSASDKLPVEVEIPGQENAARGSTGSVRWYPLGYAGPSTSTDTHPSMSLFPVEGTAVSNVVYGIRAATGQNAPSNQTAISNQIAVQQPSDFGREYGSMPLGWGGAQLKSAWWELVEMVSTLLARVAFAPLVLPQADERTITDRDLGMRVRMPPRSEIDVVMVARYEGRGKPRRFHDPFDD